MSRLSASFLGTFELRLASLPITTFEYDKVRALLAYLMVESGQRHRREALAGLLWPDFSERAARRNLSQALLVLRRAIGDRDATPPFLNIATSILQFNTSSDHTLDVSEFHFLIDGVQQHAHPEVMACPACLLDMEEAAALYRGDFLTGFSLSDCPEFEIWLSLIRERLQQKAMVTFDHLAQAHLQRGNYQRALQYAQRQLALDGLRELAYRQAMTALAESGQRSAALALYDTCKRVFETEFGIQPEPATKALYKRISSGHYGRQVESSISHGTIDNQVSQHNLPMQLTPIIGRDTERDTVVDQLLKSDTRLVTLTGPGGCGKTRLALEVAWSLVERFPQGVVFVPMASSESNEAVITGIANAFGVPLSIQTGDTTESNASASLMEQLQTLLQQRTALLVLDNAEHLLQSSDGEATLTGILTALLEYAPGIKILVTSRRILHSNGEVVVALNPLDYPRDSNEALDSLQASATVQLFVHAAQRARSSFTLSEGNQQAVAAICNYVQGCPLATLLAAAWVAILSTAEIAEMLTHPDDGDLSSLDMLQSDWQALPARHRDLRSVYEYSWQLLTSKAQRVFAVCCLFRGGFTRTAAREIAGANAKDLRNLIEVSLITRQPSGRYVIHELLRQFGEEKLKRDTVVWRNARLRYTDYYVPVIRQWELEVIGPSQMAALKAIDIEIDNARALWYWTISDGDFDVFLRIQEGLLRYYARRYRNADIVTLCDYVLNKVEPLQEQSDPDPKIVSVLGHAYDRKASYGTDRQREHCLGKVDTLLEHPQLVDRDRVYFRARALHHRGTWNVTYDNPRAQEQLAQAAQLYVDAHHRRYAGWAILHLAWSYWHDSRMDYAQQRFEKAIAIARKTGDVELELQALRGLGGVLFGRGEISDALENSQRAVEASRKLANPAILADQLYGQGMRYIMHGQFQRGVGILEECISNEIAAYGRSYALPLSVMGWAKVCLGAYAEGVMWTQKAFESLVEFPDPRNRAWCCLIMALAKSGQGKLVEAKNLANEAIEIYTAIGQWMEMALTHCLLGYVYCILGHLAQARSHFVQASHITSERNVPLAATWVIAGFASLVVALGQAAERAVELWACARKSPYIANSQWFVDVVGHHVDTASVQLPRDVVTAAQARGRELDVWQTAEALIGELEELAETQDR